MTIDEAIYHLQELADSKFEQMRRYDRASGYAISHNEDVRTTDAKRLEQRAKECIQLAEWLKDYKRLLGAIEDIKAEIHSLSPTPTVFDVVDGNPIKDAIWEILIEIDKIIDKHISGKEDV